MSIPVEMTHYRSWVVWRYEQRNNKSTKVPYSARTLMPASVTEPSHWSTYGEAISLMQSRHGSFDGIGFVLSDADPYTIIDLDDPTGDVGQVERAHKVLEAFAGTYSEMSPSGNGMHIIVRGRIPQGRRRAKIEMYSSERYMTMTGNTYNDQPITESDYFLSRLWDELGGHTSAAPGLEMSRPQMLSDEDLYMKACETNEKFLPLFQGNYAQWYTSQSEADIALVNIISFYSRNADQIARMFLHSALGKRAKAHRKDYVVRMVEKSFDNLAPDISLDQLMGNLQLQIQAQKDAERVDPKPMLGEGWELPPGLLGEIARFIYEAAPRPANEIALAGAIGLMAGICGRSYNVSNTGLNQYILVLASTGRGKEAAKAGISKLMRKVGMVQPGANDFVGPGDIASGQALVNYITQVPCFVSIIGEFGHMMETMCAPNASTSEISKRKVILDLFSKSGKHDSLDPRIYAEKAKNTTVVQSPSFTILGETTPDSLFKHMTEDIVATGLLPRFTCIEYTGKRVPLNKFHSEAKPSDALVESVATLCANALTMQSRNEAIPVLLDAESQQFTDDFDTACDLKINNSDSEVTKQLWTRGHLKLLKLAALIAVGVDPFSPVITLRIAKWACNMVEKDISNILNRFEQGTIGADSGEQNQVRRIHEVLKDYIHRPFDVTMEKYLVAEDMHRDKVVQFHYLAKRLLSAKEFKQDRMNASFALRRAIDLIIMDGTLVEVNASQMQQRYKRNVNGKAYFIADLRKLD